MSPYIPYTLILVVPAVIITFLLGNMIGTHIGFKSNRKKKVVYYGFLALQSAPFFWMALLIMDFFVFQLHWSTVGGFQPGYSIEEILPFLRSYWPTLLTLILYFTGRSANSMPSLIFYEQNAEYLHYLKRLGFKKRKLRKYIQFNAILFQIRGLNSRFNEILSATFLMEWIFRFPGLGNLAILSVQRGDYSMIFGIFIVLILIIVIGNFSNDIFYGFIDPRIRKAGIKDLSSNKENIENWGFKIV